MRCLGGVFVAIAAIALSACTTTLQVTNVDPATKRFKTTSVVPAEAIKTSEVFDVASTQRLLFVRNNFDDTEQVGAYFEESIEKFGYFTTVMRKDEFERYLIANGLQDDVGDVGGFAALSKAAGKIGDFLFADINLTVVGYDVTAKLAVYNARDAKEVFRVEYEVFNWAGLDNVLFQPVLNSFFDWVDKNRTLDTPPPPKPKTS